MANAVDSESNEFSFEIPTRVIEFEHSSRTHARWLAGDVEPPIAVTEKPTRNMRKPVAK